MSFDDHDHHSPALNPPPRTVYAKSWNSMSMGGLFAILESLFSCGWKTRELPASCTSMVWWCFLWSLRQFTRCVNYSRWPSESDWKEERSPTRDTLTFTYYFTYYCILFSRPPVKWSSGLTRFCWSLGIDGGEGFWWIVMFCERKNKIIL